MNSELSASNAPGFWRTVGLLLSTARRRAVGRSKRQRSLLRHRTGSATDTLGALGLVLVWIGMAFINGLAGYVVHSAILAAQRVEAEQQGKIVVEHYFVKAIRDLQEAKSPTERQLAEDRLEGEYRFEAGARSDEVGGSKQENEVFLRRAVQTRPSDFIDRDTTDSGLQPLTNTRSLPAMLGSLVLIWWLVMMIFQGEGLELDLQRRRHPMWEWLFTHPVKPGAVFLAEMLSPIAANPIYATGPLFFGVLYGSIYSAEVGIAAAILIGLPVSVAAACVGKALEIGIMLRFPARSRGALIGFMTWLGYAAMVSFLLALGMPKIVIVLAGLIRPLATSIPWPWLSWSIGLQADGSRSFFSGMIACWLASIVMTVAGVWFTVWGAQRDLSGSALRTKLSPSARNVTRAPRFGKEPLHRKEILWFLRDRSAIVQAILVPLTIAGLQLLNFRWLVQNAENSWHYLAGAALLLGTYFLWILGPRSLASEGQALWLALTWPRGLEELMKAKARLWFLIATTLVMLVLAYALMRHPNDGWKLLLVAIGWLAFGRSMAEKAVTLVSATSSSGEPEPIPKGRRWAASLGTFTFAVGVITLRWQIAVIGIVYSWVTAAAMWENFRARLPFLFDPWSEKVPPPPTLMHAMIAISVLAEGGAVLTGIFIVFASSTEVAAIGLAQALAYGLLAIIVSFVVSTMLQDRGVPPKEVWCWRTQNTSDQFKPWWWSGDGTRDRRFFKVMSVGAMGGLLLGLLALGYVSLLSWFPTFSEMFRVAREQMEEFPSLKLSYAVMAIAFAPFAEEYLFRGLLFRALDREWGGWRALVGSAAFFAIYHPPLAWVPVGLLGLTNALLFKKTGRLAPAVILHMIYNAVVFSK